MSGLVGRDREIAILSGSGRRLTIVHGEPGAGKTSLLRAALASLDLSTMSSRKELSRQSGSLQIGLLETLGEALASGHQSGVDVLRDASAKVVDASRSVAADRANQLMRGLLKIVTGSLRGYLSGKIGESGVEAAGDFFGYLTHDSYPDLESRIRSNVHEDFNDVFLRFVGEVVKARGDREIVLALDNADKLSTPDQQQLLDLVRRIPEGLSVWLGYATREPSDVHLLDGLRMEGAEVLRLEGLAEGDVRQWLGEEVSDVTAHRVYQLTAGYPLYVEAVVDYMEKGGDLEEIYVDPEFRDRARLDTVQVIMERAFRDLDHETREACILLSAYSERPPDEEIPRIIRASPARWDAIERRLEYAHLVTSGLEGRRWFHEVKRDAIWRTVLRVNEKKMAAENALQSIPRLCEKLKSLSVSLALDFVRVFEDYSILVETDRREICSDILGFSPSQLRVVSSFIELWEGSSDPALLVGDLALYLRSVYGSDGNIVDSIKSVGESSAFVLVESDDRHQAVLSFRNCTEALLSIMACTYLRLDRVLMPNLPRFVFYVGVQPLLGSFRRSIFGIGVASVDGVFRDLSEEDGSFEYALYAVGSVSGQPCWCAVTFSTPEDLRQAVRLLRGSAPIEMMDVTLSFEEVVEYPYHPRHITALSAFEYHSHHAVEILNDGGGERNLYLRGLEKQSAAYEIYRSIANPLERCTVGLTRPRGFAVAFEGDAFLQVNLIGFSGVLEVDMPVSWSWDSVVHLIHRHIPENVYIEGMVLGQGRLPVDEPFKMVIDYLRDRQRRHHSQVPKRFRNVRHLRIDDFVWEIFQRRMAEISVGEALASQGLIEGEGWDKTSLESCVVINLDQATLVPAVQYDALYVRPSSRTLRLRMFRGRDDDHLKNLVSKITTDGSSEIWRSSASVVWGVHPVLLQGEILANFEVSISL
ncbi:ATP-binding protein [Aeromicrobium sp. PE09-221]|uniref:AAA family ATPase n=1 Tax=Aeromicrobium sp. PE09-221 TaxID=1898043 RepID=UPI00148291D7|nr:ATP-binding protein [Aeromicrobium sp. PE09-221]